MNAISLARTTTNGCALNGATVVAAANGAYHSASVNVTANVTTVNGITNGITKNHSNNIHTMTNKQFKANAAAAATTTLQASMNSSTTITTTTPPSSKTKRIDLAAKIIQQSDIICFDVDSTVICEEGIDELADFCGKGEEVARVTKEAMGGSMSFQDALRIRLNIIRPTQQQIIEFIQQRPSTLTPNIKSFIEYLRTNGKQVYLISGGFDCLIEPVARELGVPLTNLYANKLLFHFDGEYASFDTTQPTSKSGGKAEAISFIRQRQQTKKSKDSENILITMIGDGATDLEAVPPANYFIGFGGNVQRNEVYQRAQYYINDFDQLM